ncbi:MAG: alpha/beta fold hydrolase [Deltaproteobacteria bacterium]
MIIEINNTKINYEIQGEGENILILHGWGGCIDSMRPVINNLKNHFRVISLDFPGHGRSSVPESPWGVPEYANCLLKFMQALKIEKTNIIAHSFGGRVTIVLASDHPEMVGKIILVDAGGIRPKRKIKYYLKVYTYKLIKNSLKLFIRNKQSYERIIEKARKKFGSSDYKQLDGIMRSSFVKTVNQDLKPLLKYIKASTLLIWGENDTDTPVYMGRIMEKEIPDAGLVVLKGAGHFSYLDKSGEFNKIIDNFLVRG